MSRPIIMVIDDDAQVLRAISRDLRLQYGKQYKLLSTESAREALDTLVEMKNAGDVVALFISDQRMPEMPGVDFLQKAIEVYPEAKRVLLTAYSDTDAAIKAINDVQLDYYLMKPWDPPEERLYPVVNDLLDDWHTHYVPEFKGIKLIGYQFSPQSHTIKDYLGSNLIPYQYLDVERNEEAKKLMRVNNLNHEALPLVFFEDGSYQSKPAIADIAQKIGISTELTNDIYDVVIIGAGPAGLAASVYGASEGLKTLLIERKAPGGQAGSSSRIENYLGFPAGLSGADLTHRAISQARRLGAEFLSPHEVRDIQERDGYKYIILDNGSEVISRSIVITTGVDYRKLEVDGVDQFTGAGIYYGAAVTEASACKDKEVYIIGGGNSAGQAAMYLSKFAKHVYIVIRRENLTATMSAYLIDQIGHTDNITVMPFTEVIQAHGNSNLEALTLIDVNTKQTVTREATALYIFIGAKPYTDWIQMGIIKSKGNFIETGRDLSGY
jgi:thioredoxin reductase (NADPH)